MSTANLSKIESVSYELLGMGLQCSKDRLLLWTADLLNSLDLNVGYKQ